MTKQSSTKEFLGIDIETYKNWIEYQSDYSRNELVEYRDRSCQSNLFI